MNKVQGSLRELLTDKEKSRWDRNDSDHDWVFDSLDKCQQRHEEIVKEMIRKLKEDIDNVETQDYEVTELEAKEMLKDMIDKRVGEL